MNGVSKRNNYGLNFWKNMARITKKYQMAWITQNPLYNVKDGLGINQTF